MQASDENKEKYQLWNYPMIQYQILQANINENHLADSKENY